MTQAFSSTKLGFLLAFAPFAALLCGCPAPEKEGKDTASPELRDADGDGYTSETDCDDQDASVHPGALELCDGIDNDCDSAIDDQDSDPPADRPWWHADLDGDSYGDPLNAAQGCVAPKDYIEDSSDCDDTRSESRPGADELCDGIDNDCDGLIDDNATDLKTWFFDADGDSYGDETLSISGCEAPEHYVETSGDCDDTNAAIHPGASETDCADPVDYNCDGSVGFADLDADGWAACQDCADDNELVNPDALETCNDTDDDCDTLVDDDDPDVVGQGTFYLDTDHDGYGGADSEFQACEAPPGSSLLATDCDDTSAAFHPGATESDCTDPNDYNCDGSVGYADLDGDSFAACIECDDTNAAVNPGALESCDGIDNDCDALIDDLDPGVTGTSLFYRDRDADDFGDLLDTRSACEAPDGYVPDSTDCDDSSSDSYPGATELCDDRDNDCDGLSDLEDPDTLGLLVLYRDADSDSWGSDESMRSCEMLDGWSLYTGDCDDTNAAFYPEAPETDCADPNDYNCDGSVGYSDFDGDGWPACLECDDREPSAWPGAPETCDGIDNDCDSATDEPDSVDAPTWYLDLDLDTFGDPSSSARACSAPDSYVADSTDCNDSSALAFPGAEERCDGIDNDCDTEIDESGAVGESEWHADLDHDDYGDPAAILLACVRPADHVADSTDCDDLRADIHPGADELCNSIDDDCDTEIDELALDASTWYQDFDEDLYGDDLITVESCTEPAGFIARSGDCDDTRLDVNPEAPELCDDLDNDCDTETDESALDALTWYRDADGDTYGLASDTLDSCDPPDGYVEDSSDCDDTLSGVYPGAEELIDELDQNCDGQVNEGLLPDWGSVSDPLSAELHLGELSEPIYGLVLIEGITEFEGAGLEGASLGFGPLGSDPSLDDGWTWVEGVFSADLDGMDEWVASLEPLEAGEYAYAWRFSVNSGLDWLHCDAVDGSSVDDPYDPAEQATLRVWQDSDLDGHFADTDCDDLDPDIHPGAEELCDGVDQDCDDLIDEEAGTLWYADLDEDGWGDPASSVIACDAPELHVDRAGDCDVADPAISPDALEICDTVDNDCDGLVDLDDPGVTGLGTWYADLDEDGFGDSSSPIEACEMPAGAVDDATDCDDTRAETRPGADELCNELDDDCDTEIDEGAVDMDSWYLDLDGDLYGDSASLLLACENPGGRVLADGDCDDSNTEIHPSAEEVCDGVDNDCDLLVDDLDPDRVDAARWYTDLDADMYGSTTDFVDACDAPIGSVSDSTDCDDSNADVHPGAAELCNGLDDDCDGTTDLGVGSTWYLDSDLDGYGLETSTLLACAEPDGYTDIFGDCDDSDADTFPGAPELCGDELDQDCSGTDCELLEGDVVFTEIMSNPSTATDDLGEWFELTNLTENDIDLSGRVIRDTTGSVNNYLVVSEGTVIPAGEPLVFASNVAAGVPYDYLYTYSEMRLANTNDVIILAEYGTTGRDGDIIDRVSYASTWPLVEAHSLSLDPSMYDSVLNDSASSWCSSSSPIDGLVDFGTPGMENESCGFPELLSIDLAECIDEGGCDVGLVGVGFTDATAVEFGTSAALFVVLSDTEILATAPAHAYGRVDVTVTEGTRSSSLTRAFTYTGLATDIGWCNVQYPSETDTTAGLSTEPVYGQVWIDGVTNGEGQGAGVTGQLGFGPYASDPSMDLGYWGWSAGAYNTDSDNNDEYQASMSPELSGEYSYAWRFSRDEGLNWLYCDAVGGSSVADPFDPAQAGYLLVY